LAKIIDKRSVELDQIETDLRSREKKWIADYTKQRNYPRAQIDQLKKEGNTTHTLLLQTVNRLTDMRHVFDTCNAVQKEELVRTVFDNSFTMKTKYIEHLPHSRD